MTGMAAVRDAIRRELRADGCSQADLAAYLGVTQPCISRILSGRRGGLDDFMVAMAAAVGISKDRITRLYLGGTE